VAEATAGAAPVRTALAVGALLLVGSAAAVLWAFPDAVSRVRQLAAPHARAPEACLLDERACTATFADGTAVTLDVTPRGMPAETPLTFTVSVEPPGPVPRAVEVQGLEMNMGLIRAPLAAAGPEGVYTGTAVVPVCTTERMRWHADVVLDGRSAGFGFDADKTPPAPEPVYGDFTLQAEAGPLSLSDFEGEVVVVYFGYLSCPDICPTTLQTVGAAFGHLTEAERARVRGLMVSLDPERDSPERLARYTEWFHPRIAGVTGPAEEVEEVAERWGVAWRRVEDTDSALGYTLDHDTRAFLVAPDGHVVGFVRHGTSPEALARQIRTLL
jgi:protein SCO1